MKKFDKKQTTGALDDDEKTVKQDKAGKKLKEKAQPPVQQPR